MSFHVVSKEDIKSGRTTDVYFLRTKKILNEKKISRVVVAEVTTTSFPRGWDWGVLAGIEEVSNLLEGCNVDVYAMDEGCLFFRNEPVLFIEGKYEEFGIFETALLGLLAQASGIATQASRCKIKSGNLPIYSFGTRRMHPTISPMVDRCAFIGGCDGVSGIAGAEIVGEDAVGTMSHSLIIMFEDQKKAWQVFDEVIDEDVPRIVLVATYFDEKIESIMAAETIKKLDGVRLDTPQVEEGRWKIL